LKVQIETIKGSRHIDPIRSSVDLWSAKLQNFSEVFEQWLSFQQKWIGLEPVFQSDELLKEV
jgi:dynein heavy chain